MPLPDVGADEWNSYSADQFGAQADQKIGAMTFGAAANSRIADLNNLYAPPPAPDPGLTARLGGGDPNDSVQSGPDVTPPAVDNSADVAPAAPSPAGASSGLPAPDAPLPASFGPVARPSAPTVAPSSPPQSGGRDLVADAMNTADRYQIDPQLFVSLVQQESNFNPNARSPVGAQGLTQLMPGTARGLGVTDPNDPAQNLDAGARYLRQNLDRFGGDVTKALAAYNAGPGAVEKFGGIPPYEETRRYVDSILGRMRSEESPNAAGGVNPGPSEGIARAGGALSDARKDISQFGDPQLTSDEAYAACGPAAAVRFAQAYGRNPTLREATDLAKTVGWTSAQGMAGLDSEKTLMDKIGVPTKVVRGAAWDTFAKEAQTGNPVTISTQGHYFTADGYNPDTGAFHVGKSGLDLRGGSEWMTPAQMQALMGQVQGGLLADNPVVPAPSTADQDTNPLGFLGRAKDSMLSSLTGAVQSAIGSGQQPVNAPGNGYDPSSMTGPTPPADAGIPARPVGADLPSGGPTVGDALGNAFNAPVSTQTEVDARVAQRGPLQTPSVGDVASTVVTGRPFGQVNDPAELRAGIDKDIAEGNPLRDVPVLGGVSTMIAQQLTHPENYVLGGPLEAGAKEIIANTGLRETPALVQAIAKNMIEGAGFTGTGAAAEPGATPGSVAQSAAAGAALGGGLGLVGKGVEAAAGSPAVRQFASAEEGSFGLPGSIVPGSAAKPPAGPAYQSVMPQETFQTPTPTPPGPAPSERVSALSQWLTQHFTDRDVALSRVQEDYAKALGRPLNADEMVYELNRHSSDPAAIQNVDEKLKPALQAVGDDYNALRDYVTLRSNVQVAEGAGTKVQEAGLARDVPSNLRDDLNAANTSLRMRQDALTTLQSDSVPDQARIQNAQRSVNSAQRIVQRREDAINAWQTSNTQQSATEGANAAERRRFSGGLTVADSERALQNLESQLGPERFQKIQDAGNQVSDFSRQLRQRLVDSGVLSQDQADQMDRLYPDWAKTRVLDYMKDPTGGQAAGSKIGLSDRGLRQYSLEGTTRAREDPLASTVAYAHQVERMAMKNETFNALRTIDQASPEPMLRKVPQDFTPTKDQVTIVGFENGEKVKYVTDNKMLGEAINGTSILPVPEWTTAWQKIFRSLATSRNPVFLAGNAALDIPTYVLRSSIREGGPLAMPRILSELAKGYWDASQGLFQGEFRGQNSARFLKGGGGQSGYFAGSEQAASQSITDLRRSNVFQISGKADLLRMLKDVATLQPVSSLGERIEMGPRVAAMRLAERRGANATQAINEGRTVTVDFSQGGDVTKYINNFIPFFNVGFQGPVQVARAFRDNRAAFAWTVGTVIGAPTIAAEVWNHADPQRAKDYADVPQYIKDKGVVVMLPGDAPTDQQGNRKPGYITLNLREWAPFSSIARDATAKALGDNSRSLSDIAQSAGVGLSPTQASSPGQLGTETMAGIPVLPAAAQIQFNRDFFRNRDIVTNRSDQNASAAAKALTPVIQAAVDKMGLNAEIRPSAVDFFIRNQGAGVGGAVLGASDLAAGTARKDTSATSLPVVGGLVGRFAGNQTGQTLQTARDDSVTPSARQILRQNGITSTPGPVSSSINQIPLKVEEETRYQQLSDRYIDEAIHKLAASAEFASKNQQGKNSMMQGVIDGARSKAGIEVLNTIPADEKQRRLRTKSTAP